MIELVEKQLAPENLLLDPNNYRFQDLEGFVYAVEERFHEDSVQKRATQRIRQEEGLQELKNSIVRNGYIPVERIVVRPYKHSEGKWVVIEGNRRLAAVRWILEDYEAGVAIKETILDTLKQLPVVIAEQDTPDEVFRASLMGIRHVSGIKQWGGYQRAKLVTMMRDDLGLEAAEVAERVGMSTHEVNRRYRAFKALQQMQEDDDYGEYVRPSMYGLFHEAVSLPIVREWLGWDDERSLFTDAENLQQFYNLLTPTEKDEGEKTEPKITNYFQIRELRSILPKPEAKHLLVDPFRPLQDAINAAQQERLSRVWAGEVSSAIRALEIMGVKELKTLSEDDIQLLVKLAQVVNERLQDHRSLKSEAS
ncbi:MAG TPA: ParB N-terminal domain-containing protein [Syntrophobacteraceae bacterium]|nr:ParB N-terminal domain-containing protein [Syntrophobacteraceae bacterium]